MKPNKVYSGSSFGDLIKQYCDDKKIKMTLSNEQNQTLQQAIKFAQKCEAKTGLWSSLTVAQWAQESGYGQHCPGNNPFGVIYSATSPDSQLLWTHEVIPDSELQAWKKEHPELSIVSMAGDRVNIKVQRKFAKYPDLGAAFTDHARLLTEGKPYAAAWAAHKGDQKPDGFIDAFSHIYATDPNYAGNLKGIISSLDLTRFDHCEVPMEVVVKA